MRNHWVSVLLVMTCLSACRTTPKRLDNIPLMWKPTSEFKVPPGSLNNILDTKFQFNGLKDVRKQPALVAENREDAVVKPVTTKDDVGEFVTKNVRVAFDRLGLTTVDSGGDVVIGGEVRQFFVDETDTYKGQVLLRLTAHNRSGKSLWAGAAHGTATRFGHSFSAENYYEVFSDSIVNAVSGLLQDPDFRKALREKE